MAIPVKSDVAAIEAPDKGYKATPQRITIAALPLIVESTPPRKKSTTKSKKMHLTVSLQQYTKHFRSQVNVYFLNFAARLAINVAIAPAATPPSMLTTAKPNEQDCNIAISVLTPLAPNP